MSNNPLSRILIGDDHMLVAEAVRNVLCRQFDIVCVASDGRMLVQQALEFSPDAVVTDIAMPRLNGLDAARRIRSSLPRARIVFFSMVTDPDVLNEANRIGGARVVSKTAGPAELIHAIHRQLEREAALPIASPGESQGEAGTDSEITERQRDVLQLLAEGLCMKEVASVLNLTTRTVVFHKYRLMRKLGVERDAELVQYALDNHLVFVPPSMESYGLRRCTDCEASAEAAA